MQARNMGRRPHWSPRVPQNIGAGGEDGEYVFEERTKGDGTGLTDTHEHHVHCHRQVDGLNGFVERNGDLGYGRVVDVACERTEYRQS